MTQLCSKFIFPVRFFRIPSDYFNHNTREGARTSLDSEWLLQTATRPKGTLKCRSFRSPKPPAWYCPPPHSSTPGHLRADSGGRFSGLNLRHWVTKQRMKSWFSLFILWPIYPTACKYQYEKITINSRSPLPGILPASFSVRNMRLTLLVLCPLTFVRGHHVIYIRRISPGVDKSTPADVIASLANMTPHPSISSGFSFRSPVTHH